eukprot:TRINITY_DN441_c0_g1_i7.p1 TRINITY_DN441_c0_g1~~TRINITY_DN441_c0_g1_i7.p1  ORF type:complete len:241 (+),score=46.37 TRINITY_DN441_c0_g1_i7:628-1350(+)
MHDKDKKLLIREVKPLLELKHSNYLTQKNQRKLCSVSEMLEKNSKARENSITRINSMRITRWTSKYAKMQAIKADMRKRWSENSRKLRECDREKYEKARANRSQYDIESNKRLIAINSHELAKQELSLKNVRNRNDALQAKFREQEKVFASHYMRWKKMQQRAREMARTNILYKELLRNQRRQMISYRQEILTAFIKSQQRNVQAIQTPDPSVIKPGYYMLSPKLLEDLPYPKKSNTALS